MSESMANVRIEDLSVSADALDPIAAASIYQKYGALVVRGLMRPYVDAIRADIMAATEQAISLLDQAEPIPEGWRTPDGTLFLPAPAGYQRDKQVMVVACRYNTSAAFFRSAFHEPMLDLVEAILGPEVELFGGGQCLVKEPVGGHAKNLHQDAGYFEHKYEGPAANLSYAVDTDLQKGCLRVVPGSHRLGLLKHVDTSSHLGLDPDDWPWEKSLPIEGAAGDSIFFHVKTIHGSQSNHSDSPRPVFIHRYRAAHDYTIVSATSVANREEAARRAAEAKKENQLGLMVRGTRRYQTR